MREEVETFTRSLPSARGFCAPLSVDRARAHGGGQLCADVAIGSRTTDSFAVPGRPAFGGDSLQHAADRLI